MTNPALLLGHGDRGQQAATRAAALAYPSPLVQHPGTGEDLPAAIETIAGKVAGGSVVRVIHLLESDDAEARGRLAEAARNVAAMVPAGQALRLAQYVVALVGRDWDEDELVVLDLLDGLIQDVLVVSRASHERALASEDEEIGIASDLAYGLIVSHLPRTLEPGMHWLTGASAVYYRPRVLSAGIAARHMVTALEDTFLSPLPAQHPECDLAGAWVESQGLGRGAHLDRLDRSARGASIQREIRIDETLFAELRPEQLLDALRSFVQQKADDLVRKASEQIERNRVEHLAPILDQLERQTWETLRGTRRVASAERFVDCVGDALKDPAERLALAIGEAREACAADEDEMEALEKDLAGLIRRLPYPAAVAVRGLGLGALGVWAYLFLQGLFGWDPNFTVLSIALGLVGVGLVVVWYARVRARLAELRRRYLVLAERRMQRLVALAVLEAAARIVSELRERAVGENQSLARRLRRLRKTLEALRDRCALRVQDRVLEDLGTTDFSVFVPTPQDWSTADLAQRFPLPAQFDLPGHLLERLMAAPEPTAEELDEAIVDAVHGALLPDLWSDLDALLAESETVRATMTRVLGAVTAPLVRVEEMIQAQSLRRFVTLNRELPGLHDLSEAAGVQGRLPTTDADSVVHIAGRAVSTVTLARGGHHGE